MLLLRGLYCIGFMADGFNTDQEGGGVEPGEWAEGGVDSVGFIVRFEKGASLLVPSF